MREDLLPELGLTVTEAAQQLGVTRTTLLCVLNGHAAISPEMALRPEQWLGIENGGRADLWIAQQAAYDFWQARQKGVAVRRANRSRGVRQASTPKSPIGLGCRRELEFP
ncbi:MAG: HigA family addiction module antidote protein [Burkholderiales bacterium]|nr:HigA family addiction module antidote protein [Burkholderiales bacterium]